MALNGNPDPKVKRRTLADQLRISEEKGAWEEIEFPAELPPRKLPRWHVTVEMMKTELEEYKELSKKEIYRFWEYGDNPSNCLYNLFFNVKNSFSYATAIELFGKTDKLYEMFSEKTPVEFFENLTADQQKKLIEWHNKICTNCYRSMKYQ